MTNTTAMDVILCRNVLMYFTPQAQRAAVARLARSLVDGGWLGVSAAEGSVDLLRPLAAVSFPDAFLYRKEAAGFVPPPIVWAPAVALPSPLVVSASEAPVVCAVDAPAPPAEWSEPAPRPSGPGCGRGTIAQDKESSVIFGMPAEA